MMCTKCHKNEAEWFGIDAGDLCQDCWEEHCNKTYWEAVAKYPEFMGFPRLGEVDKRGD